MEAMKAFLSVLLALWNETEGQDLVEYSLLLGFLALAAIAVLSGVRTSMTSIWNKANSTLSSAVSSAS